MLVGAVAILVFVTFAAAAAHAIVGSDTTSGESAKTAVKSVNGDAANAAPGSPQSSASAPAAQPNASQPKVADPKASQPQAPQSKTPDSKAAQPADKGKLQPRSMPVCQWTDNFYTCFPDTNMAEAVARAVGASSANDVFTSSMRDTTYLVINGDNIDDISGIQNFPMASTIIFNGDNTFTNHWNGLQPLDNMLMVTHFGLNHGTHYSASMIPDIKRYIANLNQLDLTYDGYGQSSDGPVGAANMLQQIKYNFYNQDISLDVSGNHLPWLVDLDGMAGLHRLDARDQTLDWGEFDSWSQKPNSPFSLGGALNIDGTPVRQGSGGSPSGGSFNPASGAWVWPTTEKGMHSFDFYDSGTYNGASYTFSGTYKENISRPGITLYGNGGTPAVNSYWVLPGFSLSMPSATWAHHRLTGWYTAATGGTKANFPIIVQDANITLWAHWEEVPKVTVTFDSQGGSAVPPADVYPGDPVGQPTNPTKGMSIFQGWYTQAGSKWTFTSPVPGAMTLYAHWTDPVTVTFDPNGGINGPPGQQVMPGQKANAPGITPTKGDSRFDGWFTAPSGGRQWVFTSDTVSSNTTLYAHWTDRVVVTFDTQGGSAVPSQRLLPGSAVTQPGTNPTKGDSRFDGWFTAAIGGRQWAFASDTVSSNTTIYAHWTDRYNVTFDANGGTGAPGVQRLLSGSHATDPGVTPTKGDSRFDGWFTAASGGRKWDFPNDTVNADMTLYAQWTERVDVRFDANGGSPAPVAQRVLIGDHANQPGFSPSKDHARFDGWFTAASGGRKWDFPNDTVSTSMTLYAQWTSYTVTFDPRNGQATSSVPAAPGERITAPTDPAKGDSRFDGWFTGSDSKWNFVSDTVSGDMTLHAKWTDRVTVSFDTNGGAETYPDQRVLIGDTATRPTNPTWADHSYAGWFTSNDEPWDFLRPVSASMTLKAKWDTFKFTIDPAKGPKAGGTSVTISPVQQSSVKFTQVSGGAAFSVALGSEGFLYAWGDNGYGQLGNTSRYSSTVPVRVSTAPGITIVTMAAGPNHVIAIGSDGNAYAWGMNWGQLGDGTSSDKTRPVIFQLPTGVRALKVSAGARHSLVVGDDGKVYVAGFNNRHQINSDTNLGIHSTPLAVSAPGGRRFVDVAAGDYYSLALADDGTAWAWGSNDDNQLGFTGSNNGTPQAVTMPGGIQFKKIAAGSNFSAAIDSVGDVYTWGAGSSGQLGNGMNSTVSVPTHMSLPTTSEAVQIVASGSHILALTASAQAYAWGSNTNGELGNNTTAASNVPVVVGLPGNALPAGMGAGGTHSLAVSRKGDMYAWGANAKGQLGDGSTAEQHVPQAGKLITIDPEIVNFDNAVTPGTTNIATGVWTGNTLTHPAGEITVSVTWKLAGVWQNDAHLRYRYLDEYVIHFDLGGAPGTAPADQNYDEETNQHATWPTVPIRAGYEFAGWFTPQGQPFNFDQPVHASANLTAHWDRSTFALTPDAGIISGGTHLTLSGPGDPGFRFTQVTGGNQFSVGLGSNGLIYAWGDNSVGQLGDETNTSSRKPVRVHTPAGVTFTSISSYSYYTMAVGSDGKAYVWGSNVGMGIGFSTSSNKPVPYQTPAGVRIVQVSAGYMHSYALSDDGRIFAAGANYYGEVANDTNVRTYYTPIAVQLPAGKTFIRVSTGKYYGLALASDGTIYSWGYGVNGQLGNGTTASSATLLPVTMPAGVSFAVIKAGATYAAAISTTGDVYTWGLNTDGQLGNGTTAQVLTPTQISLPGGAKAIEIGTGVTYSYSRAFTSALTTTGDIYAWGDNSFGELGNGTLSNSLSPALVSAPVGVSFASVSEGGGYTLAASAAGDVYAWGSNSDGQLGNGNTLQSNLPVAVTKLTNTVTKLDLGDATTTGLTPAGTGVWHADSAPHSDGRVDVIIHWNHAGSEETYTITRGYDYYTFANLVKAGTTPIDRYTGGLLLAGSTVLGLAFVGYEVVKNRRGQEERPLLTLAGRGRHRA
ncbi:hypothetical protein KIM372_01860 [Bombiscardovia nodaiensis]|uniref:RCC1-like domain-containing protein n=1 Tax=Bombiscardovia nodaiensis TaxID=2932181 RepID=A0ABN6S7T2_9BIFI|nr:hypothetical protein KIM372_01860 [Bombiscardovia nodaiensis]